MLLALKAAVLVAALIVLLRFRVDLALSIVMLTMVTVALFQIPWLLGLRTAGRALVAGDTLEILAITVIVQYIGTLQKKRGMFDRLIASMNRFFRDKRLVAIVSPAIIGLLPMTGGALFSAPLVEASTREMKLKPAFNAFLNYWFRHDWELIWPLYVGLLLFQKMSGIPLRTIILLQLPFSILHIATGLVVAFAYFRHHGIVRHAPAQGDLSKRKRDMIHDFVAGTWPLLTVVLLFFLAHIPLWVALIGVGFVLSLLLKAKIGEIWQALSSRTIVRSIWLILAVMVFQNIIKVSAAFDPLVTMKVSMGLVMLFIILVSFTVGFLTGVNTAYIAIALPVVLPIIAHLPNHLWLALYAYVIGYAGILASPLHLCFVLTNEYFNAPLLKVYRYLAFPLLAMISLSTFLVLVLR